jgi:hypothetical protein
MASTRRSNVVEKTLKLPPFVAGRVEPGAAGPHNDFLAVNVRAERVATLPHELCFFKRKIGRH